MRRVDASRVHLGDYVYFRRCGLSEQDGAAVADLVGCYGRGPFYARSYFPIENRFGLSLNGDAADIPRDWLIPAVVGRREDDLGGCIRYGSETDIEVLRALIRELAEYEKAGSAAALPPSKLMRDFARGSFDFLLAERDGEVVGFALFHDAYSTWTGRTLYLEDVYVREQYRSSGIGREFFKELGVIARLGRYARLEFVVLDWNERAIGFYRRLGAAPLEDWTKWRISGGALTALSR